jgi:hypothetical protein
MAQYNSPHTEKPTNKAPENGAGFGASDATKAKRKFPRGALIGLFSAAALGAGIFAANVTRDDTPRSITNNDFNNAAPIADGIVFFGPNSREFQYYQSLVSDGTIANGASHIKLSNDLTTIYEVSPATHNGVDGVQYDDVTEDVRTANFNDDLIVTPHLTRQFSLVLDQLRQLDRTFDPEIGLVKATTLSEEGQTFSYHIFRNDDGYADVRIVSNDYYAANVEDLTLTVQQTERLARAPVYIWDNRPWDAWTTELNKKCAASPQCNDL